MDKINNIGLSRLLTSVYDFDGFTEQEVWCRIAQKINIIIEHFNYLDKKFENEKENTNAKLEYLLGEGLQEQVAKYFIEKIEDGTIGSLINETLLQEINNKVNDISVELNDKASYIIANNFEGRNDSERIQNALNSNFPIKGTKVVVIEAKNKHSEDGSYLLKSPLKIPSNTCLKLEGCYLKLNDGVNNAIINNSDFENGNENIHIIGTGNPVLDCNRRGQDLTLNNYKNIGLHLYNIDNFSIKGITLKNCPRWSLVPERGTNGIIDDITFDNTGEVNQDGVHIIGPSSRIMVTKIRGTVGDDACVINARLSGQGNNVFQGYGAGGDITDIIFDDVMIVGGANSHTGILRTSASTTTKINNIILNNAIGYNLTDGLLRIGGNDEANIDTHGGIIATNIIGYAKTGKSISLINFMQDASNIKVVNAKVFSLRKNIIATNTKNIKDISIENIDYVVIESDNSTSTGANVFRFVESEVNGFVANNVKFINKGTGTYTDAVILQGTKATLDNIAINGFESNCITGLIKKTDATIRKVKFNDFVLPNWIDATNPNNSDLDDIIINNLYKTTGATDIPDENICDIGTIIRYKKETGGKWNNYLKLTDTSYSLLSDIEKPTPTMEKFTVDLGTIDANSYKAVNIDVAESTNDTFYQFKPGFELRGGLLYSVSNRVTGQIKLTVFNAMSEAYTFTENEKTWIAIKTLSTQ